MIATRNATLLGLVLALTGVWSAAAADPISKEQCVDAHGRGQDARDAGKITLARRLFLTCAQTSCPTLVQGDCARLADDLSRQQSSLTFVSRDGQGADLPDTAVYVDDQLIVTRLDDGKPHDVDPGRHVVRFSSNGKEQTVTLVVGAGEKARAVVATFGAINPPPAPGLPGPGAAPVQPEVKTTHPFGAKVTMVAGAGVVVLGGTLALVGVLKVPGNCSISSTTCNAPAGDPSFDTARSGVKLVNLGLEIGAVGVATAGVGAIWYFTKAHTETETDKVVMRPILTGDGAGVAFSGKF
jgi:hypothetical protein